jgi:hypothetical protein
MSRHIEDEARAMYPVVTVNGRDVKAWAKRIMYREKQGDKTLLPIQVTFAKQALEIAEQEKK